MPRAGRRTGGVKTLGMKNLFMSRIQDEMDNGQFNAAICLVAPVHSQLTCLGLLSYYLKEKRQKGIFISVVRPHYYIQRLLVKEHLPSDDLVMLDAVDLSENGTGMPQTLRPSEILGELNGNVKRAIEEDCDNMFLILDNVAGLFPYMSADDIIQLVKNILELARTRAGFQLIFLMDHDTDPAMVRSLEALCDKQFEISPSFFR